jgi:ABC-type multidrug transport system ATPase subunit
MRLCVTGRNGSGKSTLLKTVAGLIRASEGQVEREEPVRTGIGYLGLDQSVYPQLTGREHVELMARLRSVSIDAPKLLHELGLPSAIDQLASTYSTGMRARLKLALATLHRPRLLVLDEPFAALDEAGRTLFADRFDRHEGAILYATNDERDRRFATHEIHLDG